MSAKKKAKVFSTPVCPYCYTLKEFLKEKGVEFEDIDISKDEKAREEMIKKTGKLEAPVIEFGDQIIVGFDREKIVKLFNIKD